MLLYNSLTRKLEHFKPLDSKKVTIYICGITPYDTTHLGHAFTYISFDALIRYLKFQGYEVIYTQNVTDINDRDKDILQRAKEQNISWQNLAQYWTGKFLTDMDSLNWIHPTNYLKASEQIHAMIRIIEKLIRNGFGYTKNGSVYLGISKFKDYGTLSKLSEPEMLKIAKEFDEDLENPDKRNPLDITLWRASSKNQPKHIPSFDSIFEKGRPGWHIECSAMAISSLGEQIDIHGGGKDLIYPHHEAEIAQSEGATGKIPFAKYWMHTGTVYFNGEKMSKSKGNLVMVSDLLKKYSPNAIRWLLLSHPWQEDWEFKEEDLIKAQKNVKIIKQAIRHPELVSGSIKEDSDLHQNDKIILKHFEQFMDNNLDAPKVLQFLLRLAKKGKTKDLENLYSILGFKD